MIRKSLAAAVAAVVFSTTAALAAAPTPNPAAHAASPKPAAIKKAHNKQNKAISNSKKNPMTNPATTGTSASGENPGKPGSTPAPMMTKHP